MLEKLRSRHSIDLPAEGFGRSKFLFLVWGGIAFLFVAAPLGLAFLLGAPSLPLAIGAAVGAFVFVFVVGAIRGKPGSRRH